MKPIVLLLLVLYIKLLYLYANAIYARLYGNSHKIMYRTFSELFQLKHNLLTYNFPTQPVIIVSNYPTIIPEYFASQLIPRKMIYIMEDLLINKIAFSGPSIRAIYRKTNQKQYGYIKNEVNKNIRDGYDIFAYISRIGDNTFIRKFRTGILRIAQELQVPVLPILFDRIKHSFYIIPNQKYEIYAFPYFYITNPNIDAIKIKRLFAEKMRKFETSSSFQ